MNIILIEDETDILQGMVEAVQDMGDRIGHVHAASDAETALELILQHRPDIVVTDIVLPQMTGLDLMERILDESYRPKIIVISGYSSFTYAQRSIKLGAIDYMLKPFQRGDFIQKIGSVVEMLEEEREIGAAVRASDANAMLGAKTLRDKFLLGLCTNPIPLHEHTVHRLKFFGLEWMASESFSVVALDRAEPDDAALSEKETELRVFAIGNIVEDVLGAYPNSVAFRNIHNQWIVVTASDALEELTDAISSAVQKYQRLKVRIGVSRVASSFQSIADAYEQAVQAMKLSRLEKLGHRLFFAEIEAYGLGGWSQSEYELIAEYIYMDQAEAIREAVTAVMNGFLMSVGGNDRQALTQKCMEWIVHVHSRLSDKLNITLQQISIQLWVDL
ncbi:MAG TPA: response regulator, partial [Paenibacillus sp.]|nr:response regulator [Paenibacillus sp.]